MKRTILIGLAIASLSGTAGAQEKKTAPQEVKIAVTEKGFEPERISLKAGQPIRITVTRTTDITCAKEIVFKELAIRQALPLNTPKTIEITAKQAASAKKLTFMCGMDMLSGEIVLE